VPRTTAKAELVIAIDSGIIVTPDGVEHPIRIGTKLRADRREVKTAPGMFIPDGCDDLEFQEARKARLAAAWRLPKELAHGEPEDHPRPRAEGRAAAEPDGRLA